MGIFDRFRAAGSRDLMTVDAGAGRLQGVELSSWNADWAEITEALSTVRGMSPEMLWRTQPYLRTVVTFKARNIAQLGFHFYQRKNDNDRQRIRDGRLYEAMRRPNRSTTAYSLIFGLVADKSLYDRAYWLLSDDPKAPIVRLPVPWVTPAGGDILGPDRYVVKRPTQPNGVVIPAEHVIDFGGWVPGSLYGGSSPVEALKEILAEQVAGAEYRRQVWERGGRVSAVLKRPKDAPAWSDEAAKRFREDWKSKWTGKGPNAGGTPILEDGMELERIDFNAHENQFVEGARLALNTVASVYHINPTMIGLLDNANYSNVREFRKMMYGDTLGPDMADIEDVINTQVVPRLESRDAVYGEFNIDEKLQGNFEEQTQALQSSVGRPWMTADEARALRNMPALGGDAEQLVTPLNVLVGGQASPNDGVTEGGGGNPVLSGDAIKATGVNIKARAPQTHDAKTEQVLRAFFARQRKAVLPAMGAKAGTGWWDARRWDKELSDDLYALAVQTSKAVAVDVLKSIGFKPTEYDVDRTLKFLRAVADSRAGMINSTTFDQLKAAVASDDEAKTPAHVFDVAESARAVSGAAALVTAFSSFGSTEAAKQAAGEKATKTWIVTSKNPRSSHASMAGETVGIDEAFSNGMNWPGDPAGGADEVAGCQCDVEISIP